MRQLGEIDTRNDMVACVLDIESSPDFLWPAAGVVAQERTSARMRLPQRRRKVPAIMALTSENLGVTVAGDLEMIEGHADTMRN